MLDMKLELENNGESMKIANLTPKIIWDVVWTWEKNYASMKDNENERSGDVESNTDKQS